MKPRGGRGRVLPYEQTHVRVPVPVKERIQLIVNEYRMYAFDSNEETKGEFIPSEDLKSCIKLVNMFIETQGISESSFHKPTRDNQNLKRFFDWIEKQISEGAAE